MPDIATVNKDGVTVALRTLSISLRQRDQLLRQIGNAQLVSIRRTFRESGSPAGSWVPLAPSTIAKDPKKYGAGHKLLIDKGILLNSIAVSITNDGAVIGTNVAYAAVQNFGSADRSVSVSVIGAKGEKKPANTLPKVASHGVRRQNIPARPYLVFRPEDPARIQGQVIEFIDKAKAKAGLAGA